MTLNTLLNILWIYKNEHIGTIRNLTPWQKLEAFQIVYRLIAFVDSNQFEARVKLEPNAVLTHEEVQWMIDLLNTRWNRIQGTNSCYRQDSENPANIICIKMAKELAKTLNQQWFNLLMPTSVANPSLKRSHDEIEEASSSPEAKRPRLDMINARQSTVSISSTGFFAHIGGTNGDVNLFSSTGILKRKRNSFNVTEYANALSHFNEAIDQRKFNEAQNAFMVMEKFLGQNKDKLNPMWYRGKCNDLQKDKLRLDQVFFLQNETHFYIENASAITNMDSFIKQRYFFEPVHYLNKLLKLISENRNLYSDKWYHERLKKYRNRLNQCISNFLNTDIATLPAQYTGKIREIKSWKQNFVDLGNFLYKEDVQKERRDALEKIDLLLEILQAPGDRSQEMLKPI